ncbi:hypothetical protein D3C87_226880 [compost metagenome]
MIKIQYPVDPVKLKEFNTSYFKKIITVLGAQPILETTLKKVKLADGSRLSLRKLLTADFLELMNLDTAIKTLSKADVLNLAPLTTYKIVQPAIAEFFMNQDFLKMSSCYYCNIDSIYIYNEFGDYRTPLAFIQQAHVEQLILIKGIGKIAAEKIKAKREKKQFLSVKDCPVSDNVKKRLEDFKFHTKLTHNHFTLDHFYHQAEHDLLSLCLYNFVPCCYVCNSKLKKAGKLYLLDASKSSPSSSGFSFHNDVRFKVYFKTDGNDVNNLDDFSVNLEITNNDKEHADFLRQLKIRGRYMHYKHEALRLIRQQVEYPITMLDEIARTFGKTSDALKRDIFGKEIYDADYDNSSLVKYKRDVAKSIGILK